MRNVLDHMIEKDRESMIKAVHKYGVSSQKTIKISQDLDKLLNLTRNDKVRSNS